ncbi:MAG: hypothetical protein KC474_07220 [Cyanobacteria bacterium HKST-UBA04]|nr:hypothetical protein [Cyanobacteria bacterium HKST-UBA04]
MTFLKIPLPSSPLLPPVEPAPTRPPQPNDDPGLYDGLGDGTSSGNQLAQVTTIDQMAQIGGGTALGTIEAMYNEEASSPLGGSNG